MKQKIVFECNSCGTKSPRWVGKCPTCGEWNSYVESVEQAKNKSVSLQISNNKIYKLKDIQTSHNYRIKTSIREFDRVLGGGIIPGSIILIGGDPGIGKSTLMLQMCGKIPDASVLYITGEESLEQIKYRSARLDGIPDDLLLLSETNAESINSAIMNTGCQVIVIDSIQSVYSDRVESTPGSITQVRECASLFMQTAKQTGKAVFIIGHVTKDGGIAGPKTLEHLVDTVLQFEGEKTYAYRILRSLKNRYGSTNELGIFEMCEQGLKEVLNPSEVFLAGHTQDESGIAIVASMEGSRPILLEVQALVTPTSYGTPQRSANGFDMRRLQMILAVLEKRIGINFRQCDVFINVAGGVYLNDSSVDLGIASAIVSSFKDASLDSDTVFIGEIGLTGEVRSVSFIEQRLSEAEKLGFKRIVLPAANQKKLIKKYSAELLGVDRISSALAGIF